MSTGYVIVAIKIDFGIGWLVGRSVGRLSLAVDGRAMHSRFDFTECIAIKDKH